MAKTAPPRILRSLSVSSFEAMKAADELHALRQRLVTAFEEYEAAARIARALPIS